MPRIKPPTPEIKELFNFTIQSFHRGSLAVAPAIEKESGELRWVLVSEVQGKLFPVGYLDDDIMDKIYPPGFDPDVTYMVLVPDAPDLSELARWADDGGPVDAEGY